MIRRASFRAGPASSIWRARKPDGHRDQTAVSVSAGGTVAARASDFLIVSFNGFGQDRMGDPPNVRFVDSMPKANGRQRNDQPSSCWKRRSDRAAVVAPSRRDMQSQDARHRERLWQALRFFARVPQ